MRGRVCIDVLFQRVIVLHSSAVNLSIISSIKGLLTVGAGVLVFGDEVTVMQVVGMAVAVFGVKLYGSQRRREHKERLKRAEQEQATKAASGGDMEKRTLLSDAE